MSIARPNKFIFHVEAQIIVNSCILFKKCWFMYVSYVVFNIQVKLETYVFCMKAEFYMLVMANVYILNCTNQIKGETVQKFLYQTVVRNIYL